VFYEFLFSDSAPKKKKKRFIRKRKFKKDTKITMMLIDEIMTTNEEID